MVNIPIEGVEVVWKARSRRSWARHVCICLLSKTAEALVSIGQARRRVQV